VDARRVNETRELISSLEDMTHVRTHGVRRDVQLLAPFPIRQPIADEPHYGDLSVGKSGPSRRRTNRVEDSASDSESRNTAR